MHLGKMLRYSAIKSPVAPKAGKELKLAYYPYLTQCRSPLSPIVFRNLKNKLSNMKTSRPSGLL